MCISSRHFFSTQRFFPTDPQNQEESNKVAVMSKESINLVDSARIISSSSSISENPSSEELIEPSRRSNLRNPNVSTRDDKRVSFQEDVTVRTFPNHESDEAITTSDSMHEIIDDIDTLTEEVYNRLALRTKDAHTPSLDDLRQSLTADVDCESPLDNDAASTSTRNTPTSHPSPTSKSDNFIKLPQPSTFDEAYAHMDLYMRLNFPKYYHFLKSHIITGAVGSQDYRCQELEFKEAIVGCSQYPSDYFLDLEKSLTYYEKIANGTDRER